MNESRSTALIKLNYSSRSELLSLDGIGSKRAEAIVEHREKFGPYLTVEDLERVPGLTSTLVERLIGELDWSFNGYFVNPPMFINADARKVSKVINLKVDLIITSPPYWRKRDYGHPNQLGQEATPEEYVTNLCEIIDSWIPLLHRHSSVFINIGDTYRNYGLTGIPAMVEIAMQKRGWFVANRIIWAKNVGVPEPLPFRLASRHETILQLTRNGDFFADTFALAEHMGQNANPGDVWNIPNTRNDSDHLAPYPDELVRRIIHFACPEHVCNQCHKPFRKNVEPTFDLDMTRPQAKRAIELFEQAGLTDEHLAAIRAVGISDAGKAQKVQTGANGNSSQTKKLAEEAKRVLGGYFREFTFGKKMQVGWLKCDCPLNTMPGTVLDPFMGSGTTVRIAHQLGRVSIGSDLVLPKPKASKPMTQTA